MALASWLVVSEGVLLAVVVVMVEVMVMAVITV